MGGGEKEIADGEKGRRMRNKRRRRREGERREGGGKKREEGIQVTLKKRRERARKLPKRE